MTKAVSTTEIENNERILALAEALGGGYVWDAEVFAVNLMDVAIADADAKVLVGLVGVQQIALNCSRVSFDTLREIAAIHGLQSLVLCSPVFKPCELESLLAAGAQVEVVTE